MQLFWNGETTEEFTPSRGIRQGDPLSPYIFILCMECLSQHIELLVNQDSWQPISLGNNGPKISHMFFADDLILFNKMSISQVQLIKSLLEDFCGTSGHKISKAKIHIFFMVELLLRPTDTSWRMCKINSLGGKSNFYPWLAVWSLPNMFL